MSEEAARAYVKSSAPKNATWRMSINRGLGISSECGNYENGRFIKSRFNHSFILFRSQIHQRRGRIETQRAQRFHLRKKINFFSAISASLFFLCAEAFSPLIDVRFLGIGWGYLNSHRSLGISSECGNYENGRFIKSRFNHSFILFRSQIHHSSAEEGRRRDARDFI